MKTPNNKSFSLKISCLLIGLVLLCPMLSSQEIEDLSWVKGSLWDAQQIDQILNNIEGKTRKEVTKEFVDHYFDTIMENCPDCLNETQAIIYMRESGTPRQNLLRLVDYGDSEEAAKRTGYRDYDDNIIGSRLFEVLRVRVDQRIGAHFNFLNSERKKQIKYEQQQRQEYERQQRQIELDQIAYEQEQQRRENRREMWIIITTFLLSFFVLFKLYKSKYEANFLMDPVAIVLCVAIFLSYGFGWDATDGIKGFPKNLDELLLAINPMNYPTPGYKLLYFIGLGSLITLLIRNIGKSNFFWGVIQTFYQVIILGFIGILLLLTMFKGAEKVSKVVKKNKKEIATGVGIGAGFFGAKALSKKRKEKKKKNKFKH